MQMQMIALIKSIGLITNRGIKKQRLEKPNHPNHTN